MRLLLSSPQGSPEDPRLWSGTPARLLAALRRNGRLDPQPHSSVLGGARDKLAAQADRALGAGHPFIHGPARRWLSGRALVAAARARACPAVLHLGTYDVPLAGAGASSFLYVDSSYDYWERNARGARGLPPRQRRLFRYLESRALGPMRHIFTVGEHIADNFAEVFGIARDRLTAVGSGLGDIRPYHGPKDYTNGRLLIVAKVRPADKGLPLLLDALALARRVRPDLQLTVIGGAKYTELRGREGVTATGWISEQELQSLFDHSSLFVMPAGYEPWGLSYLEALACRTPVVGLRQGAMPEITDHGRNGFMLDERTPQALSALLLGILADPARLQAMGAAGQKRCLERYNWDRIAARMADKICEENPGRD